MSTPIFSPSVYPATPLVDSPPAAQPDTVALAPASTGMGQDMVHALALMWVAAILVGLVLLTEHLLLQRMDVGYALGGLVLWTVLLSALMALSRVSVRLSHALLERLDRFAQSRAQARARTRLGVATR